MILGIFDLWSVLASFGIVVAALAFAGQAIILDYIMGVLILTEGQYFKGDVVSVNLVEGTVEEVGVRRTLIRDPRGTLHSVSNGLIRQSANFTRTYAAATIDIDGVADKDVEAVITILNEVGAALVADETIGPLLRDTPGYAATTRLSSTGHTPVRGQGATRGASPGRGRGPSPDRGGAPREGDPAHPSGRMEVRTMTDPATPPPASPGGGPIGDEDGLSFKQIAIRVLAIAVIAVHRLPGWS